MSIHHIYHIDRRFVFEIFEIFFPHQHLMLFKFFLGTLFAAQDF